MPTWRESHRCYNQCTQDRRREPSGTSLPPSAWLQVLDVYFFKLTQTAFKPSFTSSCITVEKVNPVVLPLHWWCFHSLHASKFNDTPFIKPWRLSLFRQYWWSSPGPKSRCRVGLLSWLFFLLQNWSELHRWVLLLLIFVENVYKKNSWLFGWLVCVALV